MTSEPQGAVRRMTYLDVWSYESGTSDYPRPTYVLATDYDAATTLISDLSAKLARSEARVADVTRDFFAAAKDSNEKAFQLDALRSRLTATETALGEARAATDELFLRVLAENLTPEMRKVITAHLGGSVAVLAALPSEPSEKEAKAIAPPPQPAPGCPRCGGKGWIHSTSESPNAFSEDCPSCSATEQKGETK